MHDLMQWTLENNNPTDLIYWWSFTVEAAVTETKTEIASYFNIVFDIPFINKLQSYVQKKETHR